MRLVFVTCSLALALGGCISPPSSQQISNLFAPFENQSLATVQRYATQTSEFLTSHSEEDALNAAKGSVASGLKDPNSAQFNGVRLVSYAGGKVICGTVNAKNSFGGYVGFTPFVASPQGATLYEEYTDPASHPTLVAARNRAQNAGIAAACG